jgi:hypothetical protein
MKTFHITHRNFLRWYFEENYTEESRAIREELAELVIKQLFDKNLSVITTADIFEQVNTEAIKLYYLEEFDEDDEGEVSDLGYPCQIVLIKD